MLHESHHYVEVFKVAKEIFEQELVPNNVKVVINEAKRLSREHSRRYNRPLSDEVGVLMPNDATNNRDIALHYRDGGLKHISELHRSYDPLQYPLLFKPGARRPLEITFIPPKYVCVCVSTSEAINN